MDEQDTAPRKAADGLGIGGVIAGVLLLSPVAIVLGHLSLRRARNDPAGSRTLGLASTILGYLGLALTVAGIALYVSVVQPAQATSTADAQAQADVTAIGNAVAGYYETDADAPRIIVGEGSYTVASEIVEAQLEGKKTVTLDATSRIDWCVELVYDGGERDTVSYLGSTGFQTGSCG